MSDDDLDSLIESIIEHLVPIPAAADDVCPHCHSSCEPTWDQCWSCGQVQSKIGRPCPNVIPISFYTRPVDGEASSPFRDVMHDFKEHDDPAVRQHASRTVGAIITRYLLAHHDALEDDFGAWDAMVPVPSTSHDDRPALAIAIDHFDSRITPPDHLLVNGPDQIGRSKPASNGFAVNADVEGQRIALVDDTFTTGAHLQSAAAALQTAGAEVAFAVVVARKIQPNPDYPASVAVWESQSSTPFDFDDPPFWHS